MKDKKKFGRGRIQPKLIQKPAKDMFGRGRIQPKSPILQVDYKMYGGKTMMPSYKGHGGMMEKARYYQKGAKVAGCMPAQNNPRMTKAK